MTHVERHPGRAQRLRRVQLEWTCETGADTRSVTLPRSRGAGAFARLLVAWKLSEAQLAQPVDDGGCEPAEHALSGQV